MLTFDEVITFVREQTGYRRPMTEATSLQADIGVYGDDMSEFLDAYSKRFAVDLSGYLWYFHTGEEGFNVGGLLFPPPNARVREIPTTLSMLHEFAQSGRWTVAYPEHEPPRSRPDMRVNQVIAVGCLLMLLAYLGGLLALAVRGCQS